MHIDLKIQLFIRKRHGKACSHQRQPSAQSRTGRLLDHFATELERDGWTVDHLALRTLPAVALLGADFAAPT